ncbi:hypothetical protein [Vibrio crassostreae]|uniref:hypothetical protein n=1 Tax=Vibrio crassostreae TaxID=246167 RepID=UPI001B313DDF|nr:hypothetical protein [Vibrio crassostreae]
MKNNTELKEFFSAELEELKPSLYNYETILSSPTWIGFINRENDLPVTPDSIVDCTNDGLCVLFSNLRKYLNGSEEAVSIYVEDPLFGAKMTEAIVTFGEEAEETLVSLIDDIAEKNATLLINELSSFDTNADASIDKPVVLDLEVLSGIGERLFAKLDDFAAELLADARCNALETLDMMDIDEMGLDLISQLHQASGVFPLEEPAVENK